MFDHFGLTVADMSKSLPFYEQCLEPLGIKVIERQPQFDAVIFAGESEYPFLWMGTRRATWWDDNHQAGRSPIHFAFPAKSQRAVNAFHAQGLAHGGRDNGAPGLRHGGDWYAAYLLDPDGNNVEAGIGHVFEQRGLNLDGERQQAG